MCEECGCGEPTAQEHEHEHDHAHEHEHEHAHHHTHEKTVAIQTSVMQKNDTFAEENRRMFVEKGLFVVNIISSPGSGKTTLLEAMAKKFGDTMAVIVGDLQTRRDAERIIRAGCRAFQIETGGACHLDAHSVAHALDHLDLDGVKLLVIENVGNLVCPATYDLGEHIKIALLSTPEGDDKVLKYPSLFTRITALLITKCDLLQYLSFDPRKAINECKSLNRNVDSFVVSAASGEGMELFYEYLRKKMQELQDQGTRISRE